MMSSSPLIAGPDWQSFTQANGSSAHTSSIPSPSSPPLPSARPWGPNSLGGEALAARGAGQRQNSNLTDPIGSRPGSRTDAAANGATHTQSGGSNGSTPAGNRRTSQRPSASAAAAVIAAASSAAARSRATSPANPASEGHGVVGLGTSYHGQQALRFDNLSSPSFVTARSSYTGGNGAEQMLGEGGYFGANRAMSGTPKLVVDEPEQTAFRSGTAGQTSGEIMPGSHDTLPPSSPTGEVASAFANLMNRSGDHPGGFPDSLGPTRRAAPQPLRSETTGSSSSNLGGFGPVTSPRPLGNLPAASYSSSSLHHGNSGGLLSPSTASTGPFPSLPHNGVQSNAGFPFHPSLGSPNAVQNGMQSFASLTDRAGVASPGVDVFRSNIPGGAASSSEFESQVLASRTVQELAERLVRVENGMRDLNRTIAGLNRNVSVLLDRTRHLGSNTPHQPQRNGSTSTVGPHHNQAAAAEEVRALSAQLSLLSASVSQMMGQGSVINPTPQGINAPLAGLGLAGGTPLLGSNSTVTTPQLGTFPGTPAYANGSRFGGMPANTGASNHGPEGGLRINTPNMGAPHHVDRNSRLSPRPGASPGPNSRRWNSMVPGTPDGSQTPAGAMNPPDAGVIVTKWEHLNLHSDLLRSILKYGLGPPNKIQQRALPFLLRGSDIIAQAPPTQERIASYVIPVLQLVLNVLRGEAALPPQMGVRGPMALIISTTVDQATQAQRMAMGLGAALGIRVHIAAASSLDVAQEASALIQTQPQIVVGTPQKMMDLFNFLANNTKGAISLDDIRAVVLDEVDQLIARNLADHVSALLRILPTPRIVQYSNPPVSASMATQQRSGLPPLSPGLPGFPGSPMDSNAAVNVTTTERQTAIFSNTVPQDVLNFAQSIHLRESVRVLVRREGGAGAGGGSGLSGMSGQGSNQTNSGLHNGQGSTNPGASAFGLSGPSQSLSAPQPVNALGASPANNHANPLSDPILSSLRGLRQYYLYVAVTTGGGAHSPNPGLGSQMAHAIEMKLDVITDLLEDIDFGHAVVYTSSSAAHEAVTYKLASKGIEALGLHRDMASTTRQQVLAKYRSASTTSNANYHAAGHTVVGGMGGSSGEAAAMAALSGSHTGSGAPSAKKALVVHDVVVHPKDVHQVPLIVFYDLPRSVDEYKEKIACAASGGPNSRPSVCVNVVTGSGGPRGDIEMLRTLECHLGCKMAELPMNPGQILHF